MQIRKDILGREPIVGDTIVYNPPSYKGIESALVVGFAKSGLPIIVPKRLENYYNDLHSEDRSTWVMTPKTGFAIITVI